MSTTQPIPPDEPSKADDLLATQWRNQFSALAYGFGQPAVQGVIKLSPQDFRVTELMDISPSGEGEHYWLDISKTRQNTDQVAKALARFAGVAYRDVGYSGLKDFYALTRQWFSVWVPQPEKRAKLDWSEFAMGQVEVHSIHLHHRKLKRGTHTANHFDIIVRDLLLRDNDVVARGGSVSELVEERLMKIAAQGVPNYFGSQRFGRDFGNLNQALDMLLKNKRVKNRHLRGLLISSARSWLFNSVVSARVSDGSWQCLQEHEPANLNGSNSYFMRNEAGQTEQEITDRLQCLDIHPTGPMWGEGASQCMTVSDSLKSSSENSLYNRERTILEPYRELVKALEDTRIAYQRRALRISPQRLQWSFTENDLSLSFSLSSGQFATSVLREIVYFNA